MQADIPRASFKIEEQHQCNVSFALQASFRSAVPWCHVDRPQPWYQNHAAVGVQMLLVNAITGMRFDSVQFGRISATRVFDAQMTTLPRCFCPGGSQKYAEVRSFASLDDDGMPHRSPYPDPCRAPFKGKKRRTRSSSRRCILVLHVSEMPYSRKINSLVHLRAQR